MDCQTSEPPPAAEPSPRNTFAHPLAASLDAPLRALRS